MVTSRKSRTWKHKVTKTYQPKLKTEHSKANSISFLGKLLNILVEIQQDWRNIAITHLMSKRQSSSLSPESRTRQQLPSQILEDILCPWSTFVLATLHATLYLLSLPICTPATSWFFGSKDTYFIAYLHIQKKVVKSSLKNFMIHCLWLDLVTLASSQKEWQISMYCI